MGPQDRVLQYHSLSFDFSTWEIFEALLSGASLRFLSPETARDVLALARVVREEDITILNMTPSHFSSLLEMVERFAPDALRSLRLLVLGGEALPVGLAERGWGVLSASCQFYNEYGPTEATISCAMFPVPKHTPQHYAHLPSVPIGRPTAGGRLYVLSRWLQPVPPGGEGELYIGGSGVARGYHHQPEKTARAFVPDPFSGEVGAWMYRTGDIVRLLPDGNLVFVGRMDNQVKVRGYRIELGEIEQVVGQQEAIKQVVVVVQQERVVAYYTLREGRAAKGVGVQELRRYVQEHLPAYMVPTQWQQLEEMPLSPNGEIDREQLLIVQVQQGEEESTFEAPQGETERLIAEVWQQVLKFERVGRQDNFFEVGGDSITSAQVVTRLHQHGYPVQLSHIFIYETVEELAQVLDSTMVLPTEQQTLEADSITLEPQLPQ
ncbi:MAG: non-ribosomal peptide synthetase, partial [Ktedonobacteraceae bacterium]